MSAATENQAPLFRPFGWVAPRDQANTGRYTMLSNIRDLAAGTALVLAMVERQQLDAERGDAPIVDAADAMRLTRMSIAAMNVIEGFIDEHFDEMQDKVEEARRVATQQRGTV